MTEPTIEPGVTAAEVRQLVRAEMGLAKTQCSPSNPHADMSFQRGANLYRCPCGRTYRKDGQGGLMEVS